MDMFVLTNFMDQLENWLEYKPRIALSGYMDR
jgi:hypothetical protein